MATKAMAAAAPPAPPPIEVVLQQLAVKNAQLEKLDDRISSSIEVVEKMLRKCVSIRICVGTGYVDDNECDEYLAFGKHQGHWVLMLEDHSREDDGSARIRNRTSLNSCAREARARMFAEGHIEKLIRTAYQQIEQEIMSRISAVELVDRLISVLPQLPEMKQEAGPDDDIPF